MNTDQFRLGDFVGMDAGDVCSGQSCVGFVDAVREVDGAGGVFDDDGFEAEVMAVDGGVADAEVVGEAAEEEALRLRSRR